MKPAGYSRGAREDPCAIINGFLKKKGIKPVTVLSDSNNEYRSFRVLQNAVKHGLYDTVILPSYDDLGDDRYSRLENELFFKRNGVRLIFVKRPDFDARRGIVIAAKRFSSFVTEWDVSYGLSMPEFGNPQLEGSNIPFGYSIKDGAAVVDPGEAECVERIFEEYNNGKSIAEILNVIPNAVSKRGKRFTNMTVKTVLKNAHYLGVRTKKGILIPPVIRYCVFLKAKARIEKEYGREQSVKPYFTRVYSDGSMPFVRYFKGSCITGPAVYSDLLEEALEKEIGSIRVVRLADAIMNDIVGIGHDDAASAYPEAVRENNRIKAEFRKALDRVTAGNVSEASQNELEKLTDLKVMSAMRLRRIRSEEELYSINRDDLLAFLERLKIISALSTEEKAFIMDAFVDWVRIRNGKVTARIFDPESGRFVLRELTGIIG